MPNLRKPRPSLLKNIQLRAAQADTRKSRDLASGLGQGHGRPNRSSPIPSDDLKRVEAALAALKQGRVPQRLC
jgi:zinc protease